MSKIIFDCPNHIGRLRFCYFCLSYTVYNSIYYWEFVNFNLFDYSYKYCINDEYYCERMSFMNKCAALSQLLNLQVIIFCIAASIFCASLYGDVKVRCGSSLCAEEREYLSNRSFKTHQACEALLHKKIDARKTPTVALCFSGGGMRAAILSLGCLKAAQDVGLLDCCTYCAGLSGSTWSLAGMTALASTYDNPQKALHDYCIFLRNNLNIPDMNMLITEERAQEFWKYLKHRILSYNALSGIELYGYFLTMLLLPTLDNNRFETTLSQTHAFIKNGSFPMPIYVAMEASRLPYRCVEFTPFEMGIAEDINTYIPMNGFGCNFANGIGMGYEKTLGYCMATFGSAFAVNVHDIIMHMCDALLSKISVPVPVKFAVHLLLDAAIEKFYTSHADSNLAALTQQHLMAAQVPNYCFGLADNPLNTVKNVTLIDAGIGFHNLPLVPLLTSERHVDVIIIYDASESVHGAPALVAAELYAHDHDMPFPTINYEGIGGRPISVFEGTDAQTPTIIYMPRFTTEISVKKLDPETCLVDGSCSTFRFRYTPEEFDALFNVSYNAFKNQIPVFKRMIQRKLVPAIA